MTTTTTLHDLDGLEFDNRFSRELPADPDTRNVPRHVMGAAFSRVQPKPAVKPEMVAWSREVAELLGLREEVCQSERFARVFSGTEQLPGMDPFAMCYGGHQFGHWAGQLGDGRAINLGQAIAPDGQRWFLQLKGAGPTPYSRTADGFAVLRSSVREFLCSEAMAHLGVPTTRALSLVTTGDSVVRDMFYNGNAQREPGAVVCRVARSFTRFGNFQLAAARGDTDLLRQLADHTIRFDFPHLGDPSEEVYVRWFDEVCSRTATMIVHWQRVGYVHGVMNTDNMSILGETIDYGPYGWLEDYDPNWTPNTTDAQGRRYRYGAQPEIAFWNLGQLGNALVPLLGRTEPLQEILNAYPDRYREAGNAMMASKLGLKEVDPNADPALADELLEVLQMAETDMPIFFRRLADLSVEATTEAGTGGATATEADDPIATLRDAYYVPAQVTDTVVERTAAWLRRYRDRVVRDGTPDPERRRRMNAVNPKYVMRNYLAQLAIDKAEQGDPSLVRELLEVMRNPYDEQPGKEHFAEKRPDWARSRPGCSMLSCSS